MGSRFKQRMHHIWGGNTVLVHQQHMGRALFLGPGHAYVLRLGNTVIAVESNEGTDWLGCKLGAPIQVKRRVVVYHHHPINLRRERVQLSLQLNGFGLESHYNSYDFCSVCIGMQNRAWVVVWLV